MRHQKPVAKPLKVRGWKRVLLTCRRIAENKWCIHCCSVQVQRGQILVEIFKDLILVEVESRQCRNCRIGEYEGPALLLLLLTKLGSTQPVPAKVALTKPPAQRKLSKTVRNKREQFCHMKVLYICKSSKIYLVQSFHIIIIVQINVNAPILLSSSNTSTVITHYILLSQSLLFLLPSLSLFSPLLLCCCWRA